MAPRTRARNLEELTEIVDQALDEVEELRTAIEYAEEFRGESSIVVDPAAAGLKSLLSAINNDNYRPGEGDWLEFVEALRDIDHRAVPFWPLLKIIIETHENGYQTEVN